MYQSIYHERIHSIQVYTDSHLHPGRLKAGTCPHGGREKIISLSKWVICRFHVNLPGCILSTWTQMTLNLGKSHAFPFRGSNLGKLMEEIRRSPVEVGSFSHCLQGFSTIPGGWPWDFLHLKVSLRSTCLYFFQKQPGGSCAAQTAGHHPTQVVDLLWHLSHIQ